MALRQKLAASCSIASDKERLLRCFWQMSLFFASHRPQSLSILRGEADLARVGKNGCAAGHIRGIVQTHFADVRGIPGGSRVLASSACEVYGVGEDGE